MRIQTSLPQMIQKRPGIWRKRSLPLKSSRRQRQKAPGPSAVRRDFRNPKRGPYGRRKKLAERKKRSLHAGKETFPKNNICRQSCRKQKSFPREMMKGRLFPVLRWKKHLTGSLSKSKIRQ